MTKNTTRRTTAKKTEAETEAKESEPMDASAPETATPQAIVQRQRYAYALRTLADEVMALFPETSYEVGDYNGWNVALSMTIELGSLDEYAAIDIVNLLSLLHDPAHSQDRRIADVTHDADEGLLHVLLHNNPRAYDLRDGFGLAGAYAVLTGDQPEPAVYEDDEEVSA